MANKQPQKVVIVGGGYAGTLAAVRLAGRARSRAEVTLVDAKAEFVQRLRLHQVAAGQTVASPSYVKFLGGRVRFVQGSVERIDPGSGRLLMSGDPHGRRSLSFDQLIYAAGSADDVSRVPGVREHAHRVADRDSAQALRRGLAKAAAGSRVLVIGGGLTGIEVSTEIATAYPALSVGLATSGFVGAWLSERARTYIGNALPKLGVEILNKTHVTSVEEKRAHLDDGSELPFDLLVWCGGFRACPLAANSGLETDSLGRMIIDQTMRSPRHPQIVGVGDAAATPPFVDGKPLRMCCHVAAPTSARAADTVLAQLKHRQPKELHFGYVHQPISLGRRDGLIQLVDRADRPKNRMLTGRTAAIYKELVSASPIFGVRMERIIPGSNVWPIREPKSKGLPATPRTPRLPPPSSS